MRRNLLILALAALAFQIWLTCDALFGAQRLPDRIPIHFDLHGQPNGWGSPASLPLLPAIAVGVFLLLTVIARFPETFNYPVAVTDANRQRLQALTMDLLAWMRMEVSCLFAAIQWISIQAAHHPQGGFSPRFGGIVLTILALLFCTIGWFIVAIFRAQGSEDATESAL